MPIRETAAAWHAISWNQFVGTGMPILWVTREPLRRDCLFEERNGNCRLMGPLAARLAETAPIWGKLVARITLIASVLCEPVPTLEAGALRRSRRSEPSG